MKILNITLSTILIILVIIGIATYKGHTYSSLIDLSVETINKFEQLNVERKKAKVFDIFKQVKISAGSEVRGIPLHLLYEDTPNAYASFKYEVFITTGLLEMINYDEDAIALILGHELAHHMLLHTTEIEIYKRTVFVDSRYLEYMADIVGASITQAAGYNVCKGAEVWDKFRENYGHQILTYSHPDHDSRKAYLSRLCRGK